MFGFDEFNIRSYDVPIPSENGYSATVVRLYSIGGSDPNQESLDFITQEKMAR
jgi:hypothetical protein